ncbi:type II toxin-antitoxin system RelE/ParE family toxin [Stenotrophomonas sp. CFBP 13725]|uniref:type II toxin-antitoxin system RelE/ParE family toxin n=1 Tax=Stenotrophomonas sp. CFBP 13725 TaxID=2775297 RepID=UPI0017805BDE|nr:type II toxin-antitoxin system RelE/ParE family toxin [Stenotrophomonas sp. CFBP 13725]MBD8637207.1 type II toxin-antitoxin system RelE/ParE family toxin [Stenotrophomonas sp. CFBP 13725]
MIFIETPTFTRLIKGLLPDEDYSHFQHALAQAPESGDLIEGTGGLRKIRIPLPGRGKRGGARVIYYYFASASHIILLLAYPKSTQDNLTADQKKALRAIIGNWK